jgi:hypothetical protein
MSNAEVTARKQRVIGKPFAPGTSGNPSGRPKGSRNRLADAFVSDLAIAWERHGSAALDRCAEEEPGTFVKVIASLLPKTIDLNASLEVSVDPVTFVERFRRAYELLGNAPPQRVKVIDGR